MLSSLAGALPLRQRQGSDAFSTGSIEKDREANLVTPTPHAVPDRMGNSRTPRPGLNGLHAANEVAREAAYEDDGDDEDLQGQGALNRDLGDSDLDPRLARGAFAGGSGSRARLASTSAYGDQQRRFSTAFSDAGPEHAEPGMYASDSLGRGSIASSNGLSEFGHGHRGSRPSGWSAYEGSEAGDERAGSGVTQGMSTTDSSRTRKKRLAPPETLVIVRPPPSKQSNPLNLQIQLVAPVAGNNARSSGDYSRDEVGSQSASRSSPTDPGNSLLRRSPSTMSHRSERSDVSATSSATSASSARRVTPLYNLNFHTLLPTTVSDAGTDQKVARFGRKGIDLDGFGLLEPHELLRGLNDLATLEQVGGIDAMKAGVLPNNAKALSLLSGSGSSPVSENLGLNGAASISDGMSLASSAAASRASDHGAIIPTVAQPPTSFEAMTPEAQAVPVEQTVGNKFLGRFKRMSFGGPPKSIANANSPVAPSSNGLSVKLGSTANKRASIDGSMISAVSTKDSISLASEVPQLVAGAGLSSDGMRKTQGYYWVIKKWARQVPEEGQGRSAQGADALVGPDGQNPVLSSVWKRFNMVNRMGGFERHPPARDIPIRFEWTKDSRDSSSAIARRRKALPATASANSLRRQAGHGRFATDSSTAAAGPVPRVPQAFRGSFDIAAAVGGPRSPSSEPKELSPEGSPEGSAAAGPSAWMPAKGLGVPRAAPLTASPRRSLDVPALAGSAASSPSNESRIGRRASSTIDEGGSEAGGDGANSDPEDSETTWSCHLVLGPTTRIPIGSLSPAPHHPKVVGQLQIPFPLPDLSATGLGADGAGLTREELKDIVSVSCLFLVIREGFGGLAKKRKGDAGWKLGVAQLGQA